eukprot:TRINITY_DN45624_c0_g1_i1.p3 TRINITY_DN45624_c0_g1~~TRINITY_DN45624_c0_g1_i1.p3  ORF type:complete len:137 (+),score=34.45 TRINITY_DN45624_c0_g1_i1:94-504(+)
MCIRDRYNGDTPAEIFDNILKDNKYIEMDVGFNDDQITPEAASLIQGLLNHDPEKRLGKNGAKEIKSHPFFEGVNWDTLRQQEPPFVPEAQDLSLIHISEPTRPLYISYAVFCLKKKNKHVDKKKHRLQPQSGPLQ